MSFNALSLQFAETTSFQLRRPDTNELIFADKAETLPVMFEIYGSTSKVVRKHAAEQARKEEQKIKSGKKDKALTAEEFLERNAEFYAVLTKSITNLDMNGEKLDTPEAIHKLYATASLKWITEQVAEAFGDVEGFLAQ